MAWYGWVGVGDLVGAIGGLLIGVALNVVALTYLSIVCSVAAPAAIAAVVVAIIRRPRARCRQSPSAG